MLRSFNRSIMMIYFLCGSVFLVAIRAETVIKTVTDIQSFCRNQDYSNNLFASVAVSDISFDEKSGNAYIASGCGLLLYDLSSGVLTNMTSKESSISAVGVDPDSKYVYYGDSDGNGKGQINRVELGNQASSHVVGRGGCPNPYVTVDGPVASASLCFYGGGFYFNTSRYLFFIDGHTTIRRLDVDLGLISTYVGTPGDSFVGGPVSSAVLGYPLDLWGDSTTLYVHSANYGGILTVDMMAGVVSSWSGQGSLDVLYPGRGDAGPISEATVNSVGRLCGRDIAGNFYFSDLTDACFRTGSVRKVTADGTVTNYAGAATPTKPSDFIDPGIFLPRGACRTEAFDDGTPAQNVSMSIDTCAVFRDVVYVVDRRRPTRLRMFI